MIHRSTLYNDKPTINNTNFTSDIEPKDLQ